MSAQENEDADFINSVAADLLLENEQESSVFFTYLSKAIHLLKIGKKVSDFFDLLDHSVEQYMKNAKEKIASKNAKAIENKQTTHQLMGNERQKLLQSFRQKAFSRINKIGNKVIQFFQSISDGNHDKNTSFLEWFLSVATEPQKRELEENVVWLGSSNKLSQITLDTIYFEVISNTSIGLYKEKKKIYPLIVNLITEEEDASEIVDLTGSLSESQRNVIDKLVQWGKEDLAYTSEFLSSQSRESSQTRELSKRARKPLVIPVQNKQEGKAKRKKTTRPRLSLQADANAHNIQTDEDADQSDEEGPKESERRVRSRTQITAEPARLVSTITAEPARLVSAITAEPARLVSAITAEPARRVRRKTTSTKGDVEDEEVSIPIADQASPQTSSIQEDQIGETLVVLGNNGQSLPKADQAGLLTCSTEDRQGDEIGETVVVLGNNPIADQASPQTSSIQDRQIGGNVGIASEQYRELSQNITDHISAVVLSSSQCFTIGLVVLNALEMKYRMVFPDVENKFADQLLGIFKNQQKNSAEKTSLSSTTAHAAPNSSSSTNQDDDSPENPSAEKTSLSSTTDHAAPNSSSSTNQDEDSPEKPSAEKTSVSSTTDHAAPNSSSSTNQTTLASTTDHAPNDDEETNSKKILVFLETLGIISTHWTVKDNFKHKFTIECKGDKLRYQAIITVLSGFLHHRLVDQHPKTETISALFVNLKSVFTNGIISVSDIDIIRMDELRYALGTIPASEFNNRDQFVQKVGARIGPIAILESGQYLPYCIFSLQLEVPKEQTSFDLPLSFPVRIEEGRKAVILQPVAAIYSYGTEDLVRYICRSSYHCGGYYTVTKCGSDTTVGDLLQPDIVPAVPVFPLCLMRNRQKYLLRELLFIESLSQSYAEARNLLLEEYIDTGCVMKPQVLRSFLDESKYTASEVLDSVLGLVNLRIKQTNSLASNILLPTHFYDTVLKENSSVQSLSDLENCADDLKLSSYRWDVESSVVHLIVSFPAGHWQYCAVVLKTKMVYFYDSFESCTDDANFQKRWPGIKKLLGFVYEYLRKDFYPDEWGKESCPSPQQQETYKVHCAVYAIVSLLLSVQEGLSDNGANWNNIDWETSEGILVETFELSMVNALKYFISGAILGESDIFDLLYLFVPITSWSEVRKQSFDTSFRHVQVKGKKGRKFSLEQVRVNVKSFTFF